MVKPTWRWSCTAHEDAYATTTKHYHMCMSTHVLQLMLRNIDNPFVKLLCLFIQYILASNHARYPVPPTHIQGPLSLCASSSCGYIDVRHSSAEKYPAACLSASGGNLNG